MPTLKEIHEMCNGFPELWLKCDGALIKAAWTAISEDPGTTNHANRIALAKKVLVKSSDVSKKYYRVFLSDAVIQSNYDAETKTNRSTDVEIQSVVDAFYNSIANVEAG